MTRKCPKVAHLNAVMEMARVGMITGSRAALAVGAAASSAMTRKRRKLSSDEQLKFSAGSSFLQPNSRGPVVTPSETTLLPPAESEARCSSLHTNEFQDSCCSSNGSTEQDEGSISFLDLEVESAQVETSTCNCSGGDERRDMSLTSELRTQSEGMESAAKPKEKLITEVNSHRKSTGKKRPTELELEEFFGAAEKDIQKQFAEKYNYDVVNDVPLEGRYEWVKLKP
ncbi:cyclin-dependent kinase inhibitor 7-like [Prosopis cineraria]|uniref:cyclin-dependent kinase inhibitor 7-like n=1 Tax=Prosopis cineraria TaxID=364024 RepID=UPI0024106ADF|nr:cyclin-dependent kinase inhibitor 7-like [Prosopis cineraria]XP_054823574.1 cyclin-dependent kinase inhibitor 7-like [Prosopis cineraria]